MDTQRAINKNVPTANFFETDFNTAITKMDYSIEPRDKIYVKGSGFLSFAKNIGTNAKHLNYKYSQNLLDSAKKNLQQMQ